MLLLTFLFSFNALIRKVINVAQTDNFFTELKACILSDLELESLKVDYTRLFVGMFKLPAPPHGSVYLEDNRIMAESIIDIRNWYEKEALNVVINDPPDISPWNCNLCIILLLSKFKQLKRKIFEISISIKKSKNCFYVLIRPDCCRNSLKMYKNTLILSFIGNRQD